MAGRNRRAVHRPGELTFGRRELRDLFAAWVALSVAFAIFVVGGPEPLLADASLAASLLGICAATVGVGMILHEVAHKVVAVRFGQIAAFRADYGMLGVAILSAMLGFIFAAPGAVHHRGRITDRENGLIALAGPATNLGLVVAFAPLLLAEGVLWTIGAFGVFVNAFLAAFNMIPYGPLDGRTVVTWSKSAFAVAFLVSVGLTAATLLTIGMPLPGRA